MDDWKEAPSAMMGDMLGCGCQKEAPSAMMGQNKISKTELRPAVFKLQIDGGNAVGAALFKFLRVRRITDTSSHLT
jgi:hypothetical protein